MNTKKSSKLIEIGQLSFCLESDAKGEKNSTGYTMAMKAIKLFQGCPNLIFSIYLTPKCHWWG